MIKKLKLRFIVTAGLSVAIVLATVLLIINCVMSARLRQETMRTLDRILNRSETASSADDFSKSPAIGAMPNNPYFRVILDENNQIVSYDLTHDFKLTESDADAIAEMAVTNQTHRYNIQYNESEYLYKAGKPSENGQYSMVFLNCTQSSDLIQTLHLYSVLIGVVSVLFFTLIFALLSGRAIRPLAQNLEGQKRFITNASHELKTPLAIISANTEMMEAIGGENDWTRSTRRQTAGMARLIDELITLSKVGEMNRVELQAVRLSPLAETAADEISPLALQQKKTVRKNIEPKVTAHGDERLTQMLINILLDNAVKYCDDEGEIEITVCTKGTKRCVLAVTNDYKDGEGVDYNQFFERFYQQDESHNSKKSGFGIGLSTAQEIVQMMKGAIKVHYASGKITFSVELPCEKNG